MSAKAKRKPSIFYYEHKLAAAFQNDCDRFLEEFERLHTLKYQDFASLWKKMNFTHVFGGQNYTTMIKAFCENAFLVVKKYIVFPRNVYTQIGAFYLLYGLYYKQPIKCWVKIRLTLEEYKTLSVLIDEMRIQQQLEPIYIFAKMKLDNAFNYVAQRRPLGPEDRFIKGYQPYFDDTFKSKTAESSFYGFEKLFKEETLLHDLDKTTDEYSKAMAAYAKKCPGLVPFKSTIVTDIQDIVSKVAGGQVAAAPEETENSTLTKRRAARNKALKTKNAQYRGSKKVITASDAEASTSQNVVKTEMLD